MRITSKGLRKNLGEQVRVEREGIKGNLKRENGTRKEGELIGILQEDVNGFYVKMYITDWDNELGLVFDKKHFLDEIYRLRNGDSINMLTIGGIREYRVRLPLL